MRHSSVRATRVTGMASAEVDRGGELAARQRVDYWCADDHCTSATLAAEVAPPEQWDCQACGGPATQLRGTAPAATREAAFHRTSYEFLMMRRTVEDGERLLEEALNKLQRARMPSSPSSTKAD